MERLRQQLMQQMVEQMTRGMEQLNDRRTCSA